MRWKFPAAIVIACIASAAIARATDDPLSGSLTSVGSDTASALLTRWATTFHGLHPGVRMQVQGAGSATAPIALIEGAADIGSMSRPMSAAELGNFSRRYGYAPTRIVVARDAIVVFVHPDNPLQQVTLAQLDAIFSTTRRCGADRAIVRWRDLERTDARFGTLAILATGRDGSSGTREMFRELALCGGRYRPDVIAWPGNGAVVETIATNREAIGYAGLGYVNGRVKPLGIAREAAAAGVMPTSATLADGRYPLSRALYVYVNRPPHHAIAVLADAFLAFALSEAGQELARLEGFQPLAEDERRSQRELLEQPHSH